MESVLSVESAVDTGEHLALGIDGLLQFFDHLGFCAGVCHGCCWVLAVICGGGRDECRLERCCLCSMEAMEKKSWDITTLTLTLQITCFTTGGELRYVFIA